MSYADKDQRPIYIDRTRPTRPTRPARIHGAPARGWVAAAIIFGVALGMALLAVGAVIVQAVR